MTKTKKRSRFFAVALVAVLMLALAVPSFAATWDSQGNIYSNGKYLNLDGTEDYAYKNRNVNVYSFTWSNDQIWSIQDRGNGLKVYTVQRSLDGNAYTLNVNTNNYNCNIYMDYASNNSDSQVFLSGSLSSFTIDLNQNRNHQLTAVGSNVGWGGVSITYWAKN